MSTTELNFTWEVADFFSVNFESGIAKWMMTCANVCRKEKISMVFQRLSMAETMC